MYLCTPQPCLSFLKIVTTLPYLFPVSLGKAISARPHGKKEDQPVPTPDTEANEVKYNLTPSDKKQGSALTKAVNDGCRTQ